MKILAISDVHGELDNLQRLAELLLELNADVAVFCGDIVSGKAGRIQKTVKIKM